MNSLIIGNTSQLNYYFPLDYDRISSRNIDFNLINQKNYDSIYILFAEQRTFLNENELFFTNINVDYTLNVIDNLKNFCSRIVVYSTSELWNNYDGEVDIENKFNYGYSPYIKSKEILSNHINEFKEKYRNVHLVYPFNFNSPFRKEGFLFSKIFDSLINKRKNTVGNLDLYRDIVHPSIIVKESIKTKEDILVGSGELINIKNFIKELFNLSNMNYDDYIFSENRFNLNNQRKNYYSKNKYSNYKELLNLTINDIKQNKFS